MKDRRFLPPCGIASDIDGRDVDAQPLPIRIYLIPLMGIRMDEDAGNFRQITEELEAVGVAHTVAGMNCIVRKRRARRGRDAGGIGQAVTDIESDASYALRIRAGQSVEEGPAMCRGIFVTARTLCIEAGRPVRRGFHVIARPAPDGGCRCLHRLARFLRHGDRRGFFARDDGMAQGFICFAGVCACQNGGIGLRRKAGVSRRLRCGLRGRIAGVGLAGFNLDRAVPIHVEARRLSDVPKLHIVAAADEICFQQLCLAVHIDRLRTADCLQRFRHGMGRVPGYGAADEDAGQHQRQILSSAFHHGFLRFRFDLPVGKHTIPKEAGKVEKKKAVKTEKARLIIRANHTRFLKMS